MTKGNLIVAWDEPDNLLPTEAIASLTKYFKEFQKEFGVQLRCTEGTIGGRVTNILERVGAAAGVHG